MYELSGLPKYLLRWRFDFAGKPSKIGMWNSDHSKAWAINKDGLVRAAIEGKDIQTREILTLAACDGHDFCNFKWHGFIKHGSIGHGKTAQFRPTLVGLILQTSDLDVMIMMNGEAMTKQRTEYDKQFNYAGYGK